MSQADDSYHHGNLRSALIGAALAALEHEGPSALSLRGLARAVGVSATAVYRHFANKDDLVATIATEGFEGLSQDMHARLAKEPEADPMRRLVILGEGYVAYAVAHPAHYRLMFGKRMVERAAYPALAQAAAHSYGILENAVADAIASGDLPAMPVKMLSTLSWSLVHGLSTLSNDGLLTDNSLPASAVLGKTFTQLLADALHRLAQPAEK